MNNIQTNVCYLRKNKGWTQEQMAQKLKVSRGLIGAWEEGRSKPGLKDTATICRLFHLSANDFLYNDLQTAMPLPLPDIFSKALETAPEHIKQAVQVLLQPYF